MADALYYGLAAVTGGVGLVVAAPLALTAIGFTSTGIAASSVAASLMSSAAVANGGGVAAGGMVAALQSAGALGLGAATKVSLGAAGAVVSTGVAELMSK